MTKKPNTADAEAFCDECGTPWDKGDITKNFAGSGRDWCFECIAYLAGFPGGLALAWLMGRPDHTTNGG